MVDERMNDRLRRQSVLGRELLEALQVWQSCIHRCQGLDGDGDDDDPSPKHTPSWQDVTQAGVCH